MLRTIAAVLAGYVSIGVLVVATDAIAAMLDPSLSSKLAPPDNYLALTLITTSLYTLLGGYLCAVIAKAKHKQAALGLIGFGELMGLASVVMYWGRQPKWYGFSLLIVYPPLVWLGSRIRTRSEKVQLQAT
jgi:hypothetical protein